jgi:hypothetical protein
MASSAQKTAIPSGATLTRHTLAVARGAARLPLRASGRRVSSFCVEPLSGAAGNGKAAPPSNPANRDPRPGHARVAAPRPAEGGRSLSPAEGRRPVRSSSASSRPGAGPAPDRPVGRRHRGAARVSNPARSWAVDRRRLSGNIRGAHRTTHGGLSIPSPSTRCSHASALSASWTLIMTNRGRLARRGVRRPGASAPRAAPARRTYGRWSARRLRPSRSPASSPPHPPKASPPRRRRPPPRRSAPGSRRCPPSAHATCRRRRRAPRPSRPASPPS